MSRFFTIFVLFFLAGAAFAQTAGPPSSSVIWEPPEWNFLDVTPKATVPKEMLATLRVSNLPVTLEDTEIEDVRTILGGTIGQMGDAGDADEWLCFNGADSSGRWVLWLESGEIDGGRVGSLQWQRLDKGEMPDRRCQMLGNAKVQLPIALRLRTREVEVLKTLGRPTVRHVDRLIYVHEHQETIRGEPFTSMNIVSVLLRAERAWAIEVSKTTTN